MKNYVQKPDIKFILHDGSLRKQKCTAQSLFPIQHGQYYYACQTAAFGSMLREIVRFRYSICK